MNKTQSAKTSPINTLQGKSMSDNFEKGFDELFGKKWAQIEHLENSDFFLDHIIIPGESDGDRLYHGLSSIPKVGSGIQGFYESKKYLMQVVSISFYDSEYRIPGSKSVGALLLHPITLI